MAVFRYQALGSPTIGTIEATDRAAALRELVRQGLTPRMIEAVEGSPDRGRPRVALPGRRAMSRSEFTSFIRELATAIEAGLPLVTALRTLLRQRRGERQRGMIESIIADVERGRSLADAAASAGKPFSELTINLIRAGEASGRLDVTLMQAAELLEGDLKMRRAVLSATAYPGILAALIVTAIVVVMTVIVPKILGAVEGQVFELPMPTRIVRGVAVFFAQYWLPAIGVVGVAALVWLRVYSDPAGRLVVDRTLLRTPVVGRLLRDAAVARFARTLGTLTQAGVPVLSALRLTKGTLGNRAIERVIESVCEDVSRGRTIADPLEESGYFPPILVQIVNLGERSGRLDQTLMQASHALESRTEQSIRLLTAVLPPLLVVVLAGVVGFIVLAILLPLIEFQEAAFA